MGKQTDHRRPRPKIYLVEWTDSCTVGGWRRTAEPYMFEPSYCETVGYLVNMDEHAITLALSRGADECSSEWCDLMTIPMAAVTSISELRF
ncbi:hypothetical protein B0G77_3899 [Paraburkholderia sp. BL10I2N1]|nr:hypothetical protein B0G77_3899 [Paraburkholderia sp. BL10I2N1]